MFYEKVKMKLREFPSQVYPRILWVCVYPVEEELQRIFELDNLTEDPDLEANGNAIPVRRKEDGRFGVLVTLTALAVKTVAHECSHAVDYFNTECDLRLSTDFQRGEARAYLQGWVAECLYKTIMEGIYHVFGGENSK